MLGDEESDRWEGGGGPLNPPMLGDFELVLFLVAITGSSPDKDFLTFNT
jgi:hypothetical protein